MKSTQKYILSLLVIFGTTVSLNFSVSANSSSTNELLSIEQKQKLIKNFIQFAQLEQQQNQLNKSCQKGNLVACVELKKVDRQIEQLNQR